MQVARLLEEVFGVDEQAQVLIITLRELLNAPKKLRRSGGPYCARRRIPPGYENRKHGAPSMGL
ncbi:hypothetical protein MY8738_002559 [Beauveria namnaoensis]